MHATLYKSGVGSFEMLDRAATTEQVRDRLRRMATIPAIGDTNHTTHITIEDNCETLDVIYRDECTQLLITISHMGHEINVYAIVENMLLPGRGIKVTQDESVAVRNYEIDMEHIVAALTAILEKAEIDTPYFDTGTAHEIQENIYNNFFYTLDTVKRVGDARGEAA
ncbi:hypothetical protein [Corynebacterium minutissimum]|uniref:Uncharacterized protein n=1 Tax=Corynebacterium minutissimum TaxID=38301 RepID=A0A376CX25_9CORY|nr:hypothetical protein [Corynebacterium minutissimum]QRP60660.1 hypothetical protein I6J26_10990 [Corynebacterium minutissimum]STC76727.1 Uncharacterised protein [Corynebacterium minutissimum]